MGWFTLSPFEASACCVLPLQTPNFHRPKENFRWTISVKKILQEEAGVWICFVPVWAQFRFAGCQLKNWLLRCRSCLSVDAPVDHWGANKVEKLSCCCSTYSSSHLEEAGSGRALRWEWEAAVGVVGTSSGETEEQHVSAQQGRKKGDFIFPRFVCIYGFFLCVYKEMSRNLFLLRKI